MATKSSPKLKKRVKTQRSIAQTKSIPQESISSTQRPVRIVGFGASAGGFEAFSEVLTRIPPDINAALVIVQHLDPKHSSVLAELLGRVTTMTVAEVRDKVKVQPGCVYVIPPNTNLLLSDGELHLTPRPPTGNNMPVDVFFRSLAEKQGGNAIGVILSGTASDGTLGLKAIKAEGGITLCQDPQSAKYDGMPRSAIAADCVDFVLRPAAIAEELVHLCSLPYVPRTAAGAGAPENDLSAILSMLRAGTGVDFTLYKDATIRRRIQRRMALNHVETAEKYIHFLRSHSDEVQALFQDILIKVTGFFREPGTFDFLKARVFPEIFRDRDLEDPVRVWVSGCSTGEETYSVGIALLEYMRDHGLQNGVQIFGTDLSDAALEKARGGIYPESIASDVSEQRLRQFFVKLNGSYQIARSLRDLCIFARQDLTKDPPFSKLDLITCRNVLIYLGAVLQQRLMRVFHYALKPAGFLVIGQSESASSSSELFQQMDRKQKVYARKNAAVAALNFGPYEGTRLTPAAKPPHLALGAPDPPKKIDQLLLSRYCPPGVLIDADLKILQFRGSTSPYLEHTAGAADLNLLTMGRGGIGLEIRKLVKKARLKNETVRSDTLQVGHKDALHQVRLSVTPVRGDHSGDFQFLVVFEDSPGSAAAKKGRKPEQVSSSSLTRRLRDLEQELNSTKQYLQSVIEEQEATTEELKSANEEIQSSNEELQSTNEELLTAKEELQSTNEELTTVNEEMQVRNTELAQLNNDLNNLLSSVNIPIVMVGNDLRLRRFTPHAEKVLNLLPTDVGRPIGDFRPKINVPDLQSLFTDVIDHLTIREREVEDQEGRSYSMWIRPYRTADHKIDGAVMTLFDITDRKNVTDARYRRLFEAARDGILIVEPGSGKVLDANPFLTTLLGVSRTELVGETLSDTGIFSATELQEIVTAAAAGETWRRTTTIALRTGQSIEVEVVAYSYTEGATHLLQFNIRNKTFRPA